MWELSFPTRDQTHTPCIGRQSLNYWRARKIPEGSSNFISIIKDSLIRSVNEASLVGLQRVACPGLPQAPSLLPAGAPPDQTQTGLPKEAVFIYRGLATRGQVRLVGRGSGSNAGPRLQPPTFPAQECHQPAEIPSPHQAPSRAWGRVGFTFLPTPTDTPAGNVLSSSTSL